MSMKAAEIARDLTVAAVHAQSVVLSVSGPGKSGDATELGREVAKVYQAVYDAIRNSVPNA
jgi:hypothetical protein